MQPPGSPTSEEEKNAPLPPLPTDEFEMETFVSNPEDDERQKFLLHEPPKDKRVLRMDSELEKVRRDTMEKEKSKESVGNGSSKADDCDLISEKEQLRCDDDDKDVCERNSEVFVDSPDSENRTLILPQLAQKKGYHDQKPHINGVNFKQGKGTIERQPSNRYVNS